MIMIGKRFFLWRRREHGDCFVLASNFWSRNRRGTISVCRPL